MDYKWFIGTVAIPLIILYCSKSEKFTSKEKHDAAKNIKNAFQGFFQNVDTLKTHQSTNNKDQLLKIYKNSLKNHVEKNLKFFSNKKQNFGKIIHNDEWWFVVKDIVVALTDSVNPSEYLKKMRKRDPILSEGWGQIVTPLDIDTAGGKQKLNCSNTEGVFRIIQSIPSRRAEPFKRWLAKVGYERIQEIEDPELATKRSRAIYKAKGYPDSWIEKRMRGIAIRENLTNEWEKRGVKEDKEYAILTAEISKATFGLIPSEHKKFKSLKKENLRDHMNDLELIFSMLEEASTTEIAVQKI